MNWTVRLGIIPTLCVLGASSGADDARPLLFGVNRVGGEYAVFSDPRYLEQMYQRLRELNATMVRLAASPRDIERVRGARDWREFDRDLALAVQYGQEPMICIVNTPAWASPTGEDTHQYAYKPELFPDFIDFCRELAERTRGKATLFQLWNEQNGCSWHFHDGWNHADEYIPFLVACRQGLKAGNPDAVLLMGGLDDAAGNGHIFMEKSYAIRDAEYPGQRLFEGVTIHPYSPDTATMRRKLERMQQLMADNGDGDLPQYITEYGWHTGDTSESERVRLVSESLAMFAQLPFLRGCIYLSLADFEGGATGFGLCDANLRPRPAYYAFQGAPRCGASPAHTIAMRPLTADRFEIAWQTVLPTRGTATARPGNGLGLQTGDSPLGRTHRVEMACSPGADALVSIDTETEDGRRHSSAVLHYRHPAPGLRNGRFEEGFFAGIAEDWTITGHGFCADSALVPGAAPLEGDHAQALWINERAAASGPLDSVMQAWALVAAEGTHTLRTHAAGEPSAAAGARFEARLGVTAPGETETTWGPWTTLSRDYQALSLDVDCRAGVASVQIAVHMAAGGITGTPMILIDNATWHRK